MDQFEARLALAVELDGSRRFAGTVTGLTDKECRLNVRSSAPPSVKDRLRLLFKTDLGQAVLDGVVTAVYGQEATLQLTSKVHHFYERSSQRKAVKNVYAKCSIDGMDLTLRVEDISERGFKFGSLIPLPLDTQLAFTFSVQDVSFQALGLVVRQDQSQSGEWVGGVSLEDIPRTEVSKFKQVIERAA
ncbi:MAG: PilZ domain-containing protein [Chthonomonadaceae bacterium]|nr:PilZ domain-containing protein [Chthonomonadaceae bacterium]